MTIPQHTLHDHAETAAAAIRQSIPLLPKIAVVLGSGLNALADRLASPTVLPYGSIPYFNPQTHPAHTGSLVAGSLGATPIIYLQGRFHFYEGIDLEAVAFPVRVLKRLGVETLILTAATGGINPALQPGDIVALSDHLNLLGQNPLRGPNDDRLGPRFPDMTEVYSLRLRTLALEAAARLDQKLSSGVYACLPGPSYETPAEIRMLRLLGADVVGMSTVPEAIVARHAGLEVLAFALVANAAAGLSGQPITHDEVLEAGRQAVPRLGRLIEAVIRRIAAQSA